MGYEIKDSNLEGALKDGFSYIRRYYFDQRLEIYEGHGKMIIYNPATDEISQYK
ncbi:MAG: hypothetical protein ABIF18_04280 [archaeon]